MANAPRKFSEKIALHHQKQAEETAEFEKIMKEVSDATSNNKNNFENTKTNDNANASITYRDRGRSNCGPIRSRPGTEKRTDTSPYSSYLSPPPDTNWRRTHSDSALHTSTQEQIIVQRRGTVDAETNFSVDPLRRNISSQDGRYHPEIPRISCINNMSSQNDIGMIPIGKNTGSLPDLTSVHFPPPLETPLDHDDRGPSIHSGTSMNTFSPNFFSQTRTSKFTFTNSPPPEAPGPPHTPPHYSTQALNQQVCAQHFIYQHPLSSHQSPSPQAVSPQQSSSLNTYRTPVSRPSPQTSPALTVPFGVGSPRSSSPQSPSSPGSVSSSMSPFPDQSNYYALPHQFEQFSMTDDSCSQLTPDPGYFSTSPSHRMRYSNRATPVVNTQTAPNTPSSIPDIVLTDFSNSEELAKDLGVAIGVTLESELFSPEFPSDDCLREGLDPIDLDGLQMLTDPDLITDQATEDHFRLDRL